MKFERNFHVIYTYIERITISLLFQFVRFYQSIDMKNCSKNMVTGYSKLNRILKNRPL